MARFCSRCNRPVDAAHHDRGKPVKIEDPVTKRTRAHRPWLCRLRLVGTNRHGKTFVPSPTTTTQYGQPHVQRLIPQNYARLVHESRFKNGELT